MTDAPIKILICALGGEGGGVLAEWLFEVATRANFFVQSTSVPGVAQRTGATTYYVEVYPVAKADLGDRRPIFSLNPVAGDLDFLVSSELLETARQTRAGMVTADKTRVLTSISRVYTNAEKMNLSDGRIDSSALIEEISQSSKDVISFDMAAIAAEENTVVSAVLFGAIAASSVLPIPRDLFESVIESSGRGVQASLRGFDRAYSQTLSTMTGDTGNGPEQVALTVDSFTASQTIPGIGFLPLSVQQLVTLGIERTAEYQNVSYASSYTERVINVAKAERLSASGEAGDFGVTAEVARYLALWMCFDDIVKVARLKSKSDRINRIRQDLKADHEDVVHVYDFLKPGIPEVAGLLPPFLAAPLMLYHRRRVESGKRALSFPMKLRASSVFGYGLFRLLGSFKWLRTFGSRFKEEQQLIEQWLRGVTASFAESTRVAFEVARSGRLIKGYGSTNERGRDNLLHILETVLPNLSTTETEKAVVIRSIVDAAQADEEGEKFSSELLKRKLPQKPIVAQPIRWYKKP